MTTYHDLNARFPHEGVQFEAGNGKLVRARLDAPGSIGEIYLHGAHLTNFTPRGHAPLIFTSRESHYAADKPVRGGVPICYPWFGPHKDDATAPMHGLARLLEWQVESVQAQNDAVEITLLLSPETSPHSDWPRAALRYRTTFGSTLKMQLEVENRGTQSIRFEEALHTYFMVGDARKIEIEGLANTRFLDKTDGFQEKTQLENSLRLAGETDRVYLDTQATCIIRDPVLGRRIVISKGNSNNTVVWNPWADKARSMPDFGDDEWTMMLCIETCNVGDSAVTLESGATHIMTAEIAVETL